MALNDKKNAYGRAVDGTLSTVKRLASQAFPGVSSTLRGSGEDIAASNGIPQALGNTVRGAAALIPAVADDVFGGAVRALSGPVGGFVSGVAGQTAEGQAAAPAKRQGKDKALSLGDGTGSAPAFPGTVPRAQRTAAALASTPQARQFDPSATDSRLGTLTAAQYEDLAAKTRAHNEYMANRQAEIQDGRAPVEGGRVASIRDPRTPETAGDKRRAAELQRNENDNAARVKIGQLAADTEAAKIAAAERANTIDGAALAKAKDATSLLAALPELGGANAATAKLLTEAASADAQSAPQRRIDSLVQQLLGGKGTPEQQAQLRNTLLLLLGKDPSARFSLPKIQTGTDELGAPIFESIPFNQQTGEFVYPNGAGQARQPSAPAGMKQIGTSGGKPVYQDANGQKFIGG